MGGGGIRTNTRESVVQIPFPRPPPRYPILIDGGGCVAAGSICSSVETVWQLPRQQTPGEQLCAESQG